MKIRRSTKCSLRFATERKLAKLSAILDEYAKVVNHFIDLFWENCPAKTALLKPVVDTAETWLSARLRKVAAREAIDMVKASKARWGDKAVKPVHRGNRMCVSSTIASLQPSKDSSFDAWLHLASIGGKIVIDLPIKFHRHFNKLAECGRRLESYVITKDYVQFCFEIETGPKKPPTSCIGVDTGINALASLSTGEQLGTDIKDCLERVRRCKHGSKGQIQARRALRQRIDEVAKEVVSRGSLIVVEKLKGITHKTKRRGLGRKTRHFIGAWNVRYWLTRLEHQCEWNRVSFRTVSARYTSQTCSACGHVDKRNRKGEMFRCLRCGHEDNADVQASRNILTRFLTGPYGAGCKPLVV